MSLTLRQREAIQRHLRNMNPQAIKREPDHAGRILAGFALAVLLLLLAIVIAVNEGWLPGEQPSGAGPSVEIYNRDGATTQERK